MEDTQPIEHDWELIGNRGFSSIEMTIWRCKKCLFVKDTVLGGPPKADYGIWANDMEEERSLNCEEYVLWRVQND